MKTGAWPADSEKYGESSLEEGCLLPGDKERRPVRHGPWRVITPDAQVLAVRTWNRGQLDGQMVDFHTNGNVKVSGAYKQGKREGHFSFFNASGELLREADFSEGFESVDMTCPPGTKLVRRGENGKHVAAQWCERPDGIEEGPLVRWLVGGQYGGLKQMETVLRAGKRDGRLRSWDGPEIRVDCTFAQGVEEGPCTRWLDSGAKVEMIFKTGKRDGLTRRWGPDGKLREEGTLRADVPVGTFREWNEQGTLVGVTDYADDGSIRRVRRVCSAWGEEVRSALRELVDASPELLRPEVVAEVASAALSAVYRFGLSSDGSGNTVLTAEGRPGTQVEGDLWQIQADSPPSHIHEACAPLTEISP